MANTKGQETVTSIDLRDRVDRPTRRVRIVGWVLALGWLALLVSVVTFGERESSYAQLGAGLRAGDINEVEVSIDAMPPGSRGYETASVRWRDRLLVVRTATVAVASDERMARRAGRGNSPRPVIVGSIEDHLTSIDPEVRVTEDRGDRGFYSSTTFGWQVPDWIGQAYFVLLVSTLGLIAGPRPWRATRWAWGWLVLLAPYVGVPAYFLLGGPLGLFRPRPPVRVGLTGGWAFLLALLLGGGASS